MARSLRGAEGSWGTHSHTWHLLCLAVGPGCHRAWLDTKVHVLPLGQEQAGTKQQELVWEVGLGGTSCLSSAPWPQPTPVLREMDLLPATARASTTDQQNSSCFPGGPSRTPCTSPGQWGWAGSWGEAGGQTALELLQLLPEQQTISDRP